MSNDEKQPELVEVDEYSAQCPACGAAIQFDPGSGKLKCPYCHHEEHVPEATSQSKVEELDFHQAEERSSFRWGEEKKVVICDACSAELVYDALSVADVCPYCGSNHVMEAHSSNSLAPNGIIPFQVTKEQANQHFKQWMKGRWFAPNEARKNAKADAFTGIYLPFWTFDTKTSSRYTARYGKNRIVHDKDGKPQTVTDWYHTSGFYQEFIDDHLVLASTRYNDRILKKVEPFNTNDSKSFNNHYLQGFVAERYSIGLEDGWKTAQNEIHDYLDSQIRSHIQAKHHADIISNLMFSTNYSNITYKYLMLPLWLSTFKYKNKTYQFMVNGQTGKVGGEYPVSAIKVAITVMILIIIAIALYFIFGEN